MAQTIAQTNQSSSVGTNLIEVTYYTSEQPFLNILKTGSMWAGTVTGGTRYDETQNVFQLDSEWISNIDERDRPSRRSNLW